MEKKSDLGKLKEDYKKIQKKYGLPGFEELNKDFQIEKIAEIETDFLIREIRKFMAEKFSNYLRFIETILQPVNVPMFIFSIIKSIGVKEKERLTDAYKKLIKVEIRLFELDIKFSEEKEIAFIKESYEMWQEMKKDILEIVGVMKKNLDNKSETNSKDYFG